MPQRHHSGLCPPQRQAQLAKPQETLEGTFLVTQVPTTEHRPRRLYISGDRGSTHTTCQAWVNPSSVRVLSTSPPSTHPWFSLGSYFHCNELTSFLRHLVLHKQLSSARITGSLKKGSHYNLDGIHGSEHNAQMSTKGRSNTLQIMTYYCYSLGFIQQPTLQNPPCRQSMIPSQSH